jgi:D-threo-aldose 1-dehydrogenase
MRLAAILPGRLGFGTAPLGHMFRAVPDEEASATLQAAWDQGIRYYDTAPFYGAGLAELRLRDTPRPRPGVVARTDRIPLFSRAPPASRAVDSRRDLRRADRPKGV